MYLLLILKNVKIIYKYTNRSNKKMNSYAHNSKF